MKKLIFTLALLGMAVSGVLAQTSDLVVFSEQGEKFWLILNGTKQNQAPLTNVRASNLPVTGYKLKVIFEDAEAGSVDTYIALDLYPNEEVSVAARPVKKKVKTPKGQPQKYQTVYKLTMIGTRPLSGGAAAGNAQPENTPQPVQPAVPAQSNPKSTTTQEQISMQVTGLPVEVPGISVTTTTQTATSAGMEPRPPKSAPAPAPAPAPVTPKARCSSTMAPADFSSAKNSLGKQNFEDKKLKMATQVAGSNCLSGQQLTELAQLFVHESNKVEFTKAALAATHNLTAAQVHDLVAGFAHESNKLEVAKAAYAVTSDKGNYHVVSNAFTFSSSAEELSEYISGR